MLDKQIKIKIIKNIQDHFELNNTNRPYISKENIAEILCYSIYNRPYKDSHWPHLEENRKQTLNNIYLYLMQKECLEKTSSKYIVKVSDKILNWHEERH